MPGLLGKQLVIEKFWLPGVMLQEEAVQCQVTTSSLYESFKAVLVDSACCSMPWAISLGFVEHKVKQQARRCL